jgi:threonine 3-dehydrogenase
LGVSKTVRHNSGSYQEPTGGIVRVELLPEDLLLDQDSSLFAARGQAVLDDEPARIDDRRAVRSQPSGATQAVDTLRKPGRRSIEIQQIIDERRMKATAVKSRLRGTRDLWLEDVPEPTLGINDVLIRVDRTGICGTDLHIYKWDAWAQKTIPVPMVVGHEFVGEIVEVGENVSDFFPRRHRQRRRARGLRTLPELPGRPPPSVRRDQGHRRQPARGVCRVPGAADDQRLASRPGIDRDVASIFDPFGNAVHTALSFPVLGEDVLITGAGPIGLMAIAVVKHAGCRHVVVTDVNPHRLELARRMGATLALDARTERLADAQQQLGMVEGFDVGLEMSGSPDAFREMLANMCHGGKIAMLGIPEREMAIDWNTVVFNMLTIKGIYGREMYETWYKMTVMIQSGLDIQPVITHRLHYTEYEKGFAAMEAGQSGKVILYWKTDARTFSWGRSRDGSVGCRSPRNGGGHASCSSGSGCAWIPSGVAAT